jgi:hypothetical protein
MAFLAALQRFKLSRLRWDQLRENLRQRAFVYIEPPMYENICWQFCNVLSAADLGV